MAPRTEPVQLARRYDLVVIGGGITGAGILAEASRCGARALLVEARDFSSGTSSWSSKLVHGGLRYLKEGHWRLTLESVRERKRLLDAAPGLVEPLSFLMPLYDGQKPGRLLMRTGLLIYDLMAGANTSRWIDRDAALAAEPDLRDEGLCGALVYEDARTDDSRLVLRLILQAVEHGATAVNYMPAELRSVGGRTCGVTLHDALNGGRHEVEADVVINATGAWATQFDRGQPEMPKLRPLRGSHLVFPSARLPLQRAVSWLHPRDRRPIFAYPWEGAVVYGTTDLDHEGALEMPAITRAEVEYLMEGLGHQFPRLQLEAHDALCSYAGVRPVVDSGKADPSAESRESAMWITPGLLSVTGGKLTTFRVTASQALRAAGIPVSRDSRPPFAAATPVPTQRRLYGRLGAAAAGRLLQEMPADERAAIDATPYSWAELRWAVRHEAVAHLDDLMMRRTRLGLVCERGGAALLPRILDVCRQELGWDQARCSREAADYQDYWQRQHAPPALR